MLLSMTGFGESQRHEQGVSVTVDVRTINGRHFKLAVRATEGYAALEPEIEQVVRQQVRRGTVQVSLSVDRLSAPDDYTLNVAVLESYRRQLAALGPAGTQVPLASLLALPGVVSDNPDRSIDVWQDWPLIRSALEAALAGMAKMREDEGRAMTADLRANCATVAEHLAAIEARAPDVITAYRERLLERVRTALAEHQVTLDAAAVVREVSLFTERSDISEEAVRLRSHLDQFQTFLAEPESAGRKLEFLTQEMFRETNTIGSKANDVAIARHVIEIKAAIERVREMIQNVE